MATGIEAQHAKVLGKGRDLGVPHIQVGAQRIGQHQHRCIDGAIQLVMQFALGELYKSHSNLLRQSVQSVRLQRG